jgi:hypothetical protein
MSMCGCAFEQEARKTYYTWYQLGRRESASKKSPRLPFTDRVDISYGYEETVVADQKISLYTIGAESRIGEISVVRAGA